MKDQFIVAGSKPWVKEAFLEKAGKFKGQWHLIENKEALTKDLIDKINPKYIFFVHWSWIVPPDIFNNYTCVCFHMTDVPFGRGGSPLQNLIIRGIKKTKLTALKMIENLDAGPVYFKEDLSLDGNAQQIYTRMSDLALQMAQKITLTHPLPIEQKGEVILFKRRKPEESLIPQVDSLEKMYDFIRMLDADGYPHAFFEFSGFKFEFKKSSLNGKKITATVTITQVKE